MFVRCRADVRDEVNELCVANSVDSLCEDPLALNVHFSVRYSVHAVDIIQKLQISAWLVWSTVLSRKKCPRPAISFIVKNFYFFVPLDFESV